MRISDWSSDVCSSDLLASATNFVTAYLDPANGEFSKINTENDRWVKLIDIFKEKILVKMSILMGKAICNKEETLDLRRKRIESLRSEEHTSELQSLMRTSYADYCLKKKKTY